MIHILIAYAGLVALALLGALVRRPRVIDKLAAGGLLVVCVVTNPDKAEHLAAIESKGTYHEQIAPLIIHDSYLIGSTTTAHHSFTVGIFGRVFVVERQ